jgi:hypothetical protein
MDGLAEAIYASMGRLLLIVLAVCLAAAAAGGMQSIRALVVIGISWLLLEVCSVKNSG